jgi:hypothetical protein
MMDGIVFIENMGGGQADLVKSIAKVGFNQTPLFSMIQNAVPTSNTKPIMGHSWQYETADDGDDDNAHNEGSVPATATSNVLGVSQNHYQIIKHTYGVTGSAEYAKTTEGKSELTRQGGLKTIVHRKTIEKALFKNQAPVQRDEDAGTPVKGRMGGLLHWATAEVTVDNAGATLTMAHLRSMLKIGWAKGVPMTHIFASDTQKDILDDLLDTKVRIGQGGNVLKYANYTEMKNLSYAPNGIKIILSPYVASDQIVGVNLPSLALVYNRLTKSYELARTKDAVEKELISELTLRVNNPYAVSLLDNLGV